MAFALRASARSLPAARLYSTLQPLAGVPSGFTGKPAFSAVETTTLPNGVVVASQDSGSVVSTVSVVVGAGSRNETACNAGVSHYIRSAAFQSTKSRTSLSIVRDAEAMGARLSATSAKEAISFNGQFLRGNLSVVAEILAQNVYEPAYYPWEVSRQTDRVSLDVAEAQGNPIVAFTESVHRAAFRGTFGQAVVAPASSVGNVCASKVKAFAEANFKGGRTVVVGLNVNHKDLVSAVSGLSTLAAGTPAVKPLKYFGGESYTQTAGANALVYIGHEGVKASSPDALTALVLKNLLGGAGSALKWTSDASVSRVGAEVSKNTSSPFSVSGAAGLLADGGLLGTFITVANADAAKAVPAAAAAIKAVLAGSFSEEELARAKNQLRLQVLAEDGASRVQDMASQLLLTGKYATPEAVAEKIAAISASDVKTLAAKVGASKATYAVFGNLDAVPYLDTLNL